MAMTILEMQQERTDLIKEARTILSKSQKENRSMTEEEVTLWEGKTARAQELQDMIQREQKQSELDNEADKSDHEPAAKRIREPSEQEEKRTMGEYFQLVRRGNVPREARAAAGQNYTVDEDGGYLITPVYASQLLKFVESESVLYQRVKKVSMTTGNTLIQNYIPATSRADGQRNGQAQAYWIAEAAKYTATKLQFERMQMSLSKLTGMCYATDEVLEDASVLESEIMTAFRDEFAFKIDDSILNGPGTSNMPLGILSSPALITIAPESGQAAGSVVAQNILKMWNAIPTRNRANAVWLINQDLEPLLVQMWLAVGTTGGVPVYLPSTGLSGAQYGTLLGRPVLPMEQCAAAGSKGDIVLVDPTQYQWLEKGGLRTATSIHVKFDTDETAFKFTLRANGAPIWQSSIAAFKGTTQRSPYVTLGARTNP